MGVSAVDRMDVAGTCSGLAAGLICSLLGAILLFIGGLIEFAGKNNIPNAERRERD